MQSQTLVWAAQAPWPQGVQAAMSQRDGGVSEPPFNSFNLGDHVGDNPSHVQANRQLWAQCTAAHPVFLKQVHGVSVVALDASSASSPNPIEADACWTDQPGVVCTMMVADCLPILFAAGDGQSVAAVHAGWRGLAGVAELDASGHSHQPLGVIESLCRQWPAATHRADREHMVVWLGPCIGPTAFEVGSEVREAFMRSAQSVQDEKAIAACFEPIKTIGSQPTKYLAHLSALARGRLQRLGFTRVYGNDGSAPWCTVANPSRFFSHRRDAAVLGSTGRMAAGIWLR